MKPYILLLSIIIAFCSCSNEAKNNFERLKLQYDQLSSQNPTPEALSLLIDNINLHLSQFPSYEGNAELIEYKANAEKLIEEKIFELLDEKYQSIKAIPFPDYDAAVNEYTALKSKFAEYTNQSSLTDNLQKAKTYISEIESILNGIEAEKYDFDNVSNSTNIDEIEAFITNYPSSVMKNMLNDKIDQLIFTDFMNGFSNSSNSISQLNNSVSSAKECLNKLKNIEAKSKVSELISNLETNRQQVLESELNSEIPRLMEAMEEKAKSVAESKHSTYDVEMCVARGSNPEITGNSGNFERIYEVNLIGSFLGRDKRLMEIRITGRYNGNLQTGVKTYITGTNVVSDTKL